MKKFKLKNNMPVLIVENPDSKVVTLDVWVNTGSATEPKDINGVSHFLEHMLFKGTRTRAAGEIDREIESVGGMWNAGTSIEFTHFYVTLAAEFANIGIDALSDILSNAKIDAKELGRERQVILEEYHRQQDDPDSFLMTETFWESYRQSPARWPVLGTPDTINAITRERMYAYYTGRYAPENMVMIVVGGIKAKEILPMLEDKFGGLNRPYVPGDTADEETIRNEGVNKEFPKPVQESYLFMTFAAPDLSIPKEVYAADLISAILGDGRSSRLNERIREQKNLVSNIGASYPTHRRDGMFMIFATFDYTKKDEVLKAIQEEIKKIAEEPVDKAELDKAKRMFVNEYLFSHETTSGRSSEIGYFYTLTGDTKFEESYLDKIQAVSAEDISRVAASYLVPAKANIFIAKPE